MAQQQQRQQQGGKMNSGNGNSKPVQTVRYGNIKAAIWRNMVDQGNESRPMYNVTFARSYKDGDEWKDASSFGLDDLLTVSKIADDCHTWIHEQRSRDSKEGE